MKANVALVCVASIVGLALLAQGGTGGIAPPEGNGSKMRRTNPGPAENVAAIDFTGKDGPGESAELHLNPEAGGASSDWDRAPTPPGDGQYRKRDSDGIRSICFHSNETGPVTYDFKLLEVTVSSGEINPP
jgi:hypothetical protein